MNAKQILSLQIASLVTILVTAEGLFSSRGATLIFATALFVFARCSMYINKNSKRLLRELERE
jgi:hypothetical protein